MVVVKFGCAKIRCRDYKSGPTGYSCVARLYPKPAFPDSFSTDPSKHRWMYCYFRTHLHVPTTVTSPSSSYQHRPRSFRLQYMPGRYLGWVLRDLDSRYVLKQKGKKLETEGA